MLELVLAKFREKTDHVEDNFNHQTAARANSYFFAVSKVINCDLEAVATWAWIVINLNVRVKGHIFDLDFIVDRDSVVSHFESRLNFRKLVCSVALDRDLKIPSASSSRKTFWRGGHVMVRVGCPLLGSV